MGSPPRVRGIHFGAKNERRDMGITPACAGNAGNHPIFYKWGEDHPRVCGEYLITISMLIISSGSPPRVRGILHQRPHPQRQSGITPACAGNTSKTHASTGIRQDHPRVCGEYLLRHNYATRYAGSPPRVRGIHSKQNKI